jgi:hypothetical protein
MKIKCPRVVENGTVVYPTDASLWESAYIDRIWLVGEYYGDLYDEEGAKVFEWEEYKPEDEVNWGSKVTKLAFLNRLGDEVLASIEAASRLDNPLGIAASIIKIKHASSTYINLSLPDTIADIQKLVVLGFITQDKAYKILNTPVEEHEVPIWFNGSLV